MVDKRELPRKVENLKRYVEESKDYIKTFLRAIMDYEAKVDNKGITIFNTNYKLLNYIKKLLTKLNIRTEQ